MTLFDRMSPKQRPKRRWLSVVLTTAVLLFAYASILIGLGGIGREQAEVGGAALGTGIALTPVTFLVAAFSSARSRPILGSLMALGSWGLTLPLTYVDVITGLIAAFAVGVAVALGMPEGARWLHRAVAVFVLTVAALIGVLIQPAAIVLTIPLITCPVIVFADDVGRRFQTPESQSTT